MSSEPNKPTLATAGEAPAQGRALPAGRRDDEISLVMLWQLAIGNWLSISLITLAMTAIAVLYALLAEPVYRAEVLTAPVAAQDSSGASSLATQFSGLAGIAGIPLLRSDNSVDSSLATLNSREFITHFVRDEQLKPDLFADDWDVEARAWIDRGPSLGNMLRSLTGGQPVASHETNLAPGEPTDWDAHKLFEEDILRVKEDSQTGLVVVAVEWNDAALAARWANLLVERLNTELSRQAVERAQRSIQHLRQQIDETSVADLRAVLFRLVEEHTKTITLTRATDEFAFKVIDPAVPPQEEIKPRRALIAVAGLALGMFGGLMLALLRAQRREV